MWTKNSCRTHKFTAENAENAEGETGLLKTNLRGLRVLGG